MTKSEPAPNSIQLRDYQSECLAAIFKRYQAGIRRQLTCLPTGSGKTVIFAEFPRYFKMKNQRLVLTHYATPETYNRVLDYFGVFAENTCKLLVGFTPTPKRGDGVGLDAVFQEIFFQSPPPK